jgi:diguanylate cyclase (GGDEF)-like protein
MNSMLQLLGHIMRISSRRDRTEINAELIEALKDLFAPHRLTIFRCYINANRAIAHNCAGIDSNGVYLHNAYLPEQLDCVAIDSDPLLLQCNLELNYQLKKDDSGHLRMVVPITRDKKLHYLIDIRMSSDFGTEQRLLLMGLTEFFSQHIALLDYGETDTLTELANRKTFDKHLFEVLGRATKDAENDGDQHHRRNANNDNMQYWLAICDIDKFKSINDTHGHLIGDEVLVMLAQLMRRSFRLADQLFRFGGEEFVVVLQPTNSVDALGVFERFRLDVESFGFSRVGQVTISIGFTQLVPNDSPSEVIERADEALYYVKQHGRNQVALYEALVAAGSIQPKMIDHGDIVLF